MGTNYASMAFGDETKKLQERYGSRSSYARLEQSTYFDGLSEQEISFINERDGFYMSTNGKDGYPYIQYRGGPPGFLRVINDTTLAFLDFRGNKQYISAGNFVTNDKVALFIMDYARKARLKILGRATVIELGDDPELEAFLSLGDYEAKPERIIKIKIEAYDWNCSQHIVQRFTIPEIEDAFAAQKDYIVELRAEIARLKAGKK
ncbi:pyridoxamine 5'-phosphate oxidase family protein [Mucilaginibacter sp.]|jgi:predicted pyridoxine 5'-phosphate oxidase superfamily flavin-nucleotide-binding protein|uniref:pyridoxamine 5'-phosphate oxidase family protein n=1 Tax=Mucilaginibacter sp. TaxID=1882438 RepID=UPI002C2FFF65|nr:pyridoxamine 5'-phosphate oxidase family protein [Mucilaginibacter sp.]HTI59182.1 pyridoxamine 5'-phosphate oxidase family protein [Mucilaginibacter sp.]